jgi:hypothetical protein
MADLRDVVQKPSSSQDYVIIEPMRASLNAPHPQTRQGNAGTLVGAEGVAEGTDGSPFEPGDFDTGHFFGRKTG